MEKAKSRPVLRNYEQISTTILMSKRIWLRSIAKFAEMRYII
ncbi:hypothetical protein [Paenibacillus validus]